MELEPKWVQREAARLLHRHTISESGGDPGIRDEGLFESALLRPRNLLAYERPTLVELAASYGYGLAKNHAFIDGNKRISFIVTVTFLALNGLDLVASDEDCIVVWEKLAAGTVNEAELSDWLRPRVRAR